eukprot:1139143-Pelagomonas_calceolata.AAC.2
MTVTMNGRHKGISSSGCSQKHKQKASAQKGKTTVTMNGHHKGVGSSGCSQKHEQKASAQEGKTT